MIEAKAARVLPRWLVKFSRWRWRRWRLIGRVDIGAIRPFVNRKSIKYWSALLWVTAGSWLQLMVDWWRVLVAVGWWCELVAVCFCVLALFSWKSLSGKSCYEKRLKIEREITNHGRRRHWETIKVLNPEPTCDVTSGHKDRMTSSWGHPPLQLSNFSFFSSYLSSRNLFPTTPQSTASPP